MYKWLVQYDEVCRHTRMLVGAFMHVAHQPQSAELTLLIKYATHIIICIHNNNHMHMHTVWSECNGCLAIMFVHTYTE